MNAADDTFQPANFRILIVEDSAIQAEMIRRILAGAGYQVQVAGDGQEGLEMAKKQVPDLILSDINMPVMNGFELCAAIRHDAALGHKCVVMLTALTEPRDVIHALNAGADNYITKPFKPESLLRDIRVNLSSDTYSELEKQTFQVMLPDGGADEVHASQRQTLNLLITTYANVVEQNRELMRVQDEVVSLNAGLEQKVLTKTRELKASEGKIRQTLLEAIQAITATLEIRDPYTAGHQRNVAEMSVMIGQQLGLPDEAIFGLRLAGLVHDIGKISTPAEILNKPGPLSHNQYALVCEHAEAGYNILKTIDFPWPIADVVRQHHERMDGSGYPLGLRADAILPQARILMVADVLDAMASHRPYRPGMGPQKARAELVAKRGVLYDAQVVDVCVALIDAGRLPVVSAEAQTHPQARSV